MNGTLLLAHGSRRKQAERALDMVAQEVSAITDMALETAFLQLSERTLASGLDRLRARGCDEIAVIPYFLFDGVHITENIPAEIAEYMSANPGVNVRLGRTLGADGALAGIVAQRMKEAFDG